MFLMEVEIGCDCCGRTRKTTAGHHVPVKGEAMSNWMKVGRDAVVLKDGTLLPVGWRERGNRHYCGMCNYLDGQTNKAAAPRQD